MSIKTRLANIEAIQAERRAAECQADLDEFNRWIEANWTQAERDAFQRCLFHLPMDAERTARVRAAAGVSEAEAADILAAIPAPTTEDEALVDAAWARLPANLAESLKATG